MLPHVISRPIYGRSDLRVESSGVVHSITEVVGWRCVIFPEGQVDEGETAPGKHGRAIFALVAGFMSLGVRAMLLWFEGEHSF